MSAQNLFAIILAAGKSSRFGATKQLQEYQGQSLVGRALRLSEAMCGPRSILVTGKDWSLVAAAGAPLRGYLLVNSEYEKGIASSIACGVRAAANAADAVLLLLADQPLITTEHLQALVDTWAGSEDQIVASAYADIAGPPVIFPRQYFDRLVTLTGDRGARSVIESSPDRVRLIGFGDAAKDIDRREDLPSDY